MDNNSFVVHKVRCIPTITSVNNKTSCDDETAVSISSNNNNNNNNCNNNNNGVNKATSIPAGKPSNWEENRKTYSIPGRRSRRNSTLDDSQLTLENFGGSQDNFHLLGRNPDKEPAVLAVTSSNSNSTDLNMNNNNNNNFNNYANTINNSNSNINNSNKAESFYMQPATTAVHSSYQDTWDSSSINDCLQRDDDRQVVQLSTTKQDFTNVVKKPIASSTMVITPPTPPTPAPVIKNNFSPTPPSATAIGHIGNTAANISNNYYSPSPSAPCPPATTTTWQKQQQQQHQRRQTRVYDYYNNNNNNNNSNNQHQQTIDIDNDEYGETPVVMSPEMLMIRLQLEEKRRQIENEKIRMEANLSRQRQKLGKAAFIQAVSKDAELLEKQWLIQELFGGNGQRQNKDNNNPFHLNNNNNNNNNNINNILAMTTRADELLEDENLAEYSKSNRTQWKACQPFSLNDLQTNYATIGGHYQQQQQQQQPQQTAMMINGGTGGYYMPEEIDHRVSSPTSQSQSHVASYRMSSPLSTLRKSSSRTSIPSPVASSSSSSSSSSNSSNSRTSVPSPTTVIPTTTIIPAGGRTSISSPTSTTGVRMSIPSPVVGNRTSIPTTTPPPNSSPPFSRRTSTVATDDDMAPQSISFIGDQEEEEQKQLTTTGSLARLQITSGSRTYRIPSPTRPSHTTISHNSFTRSNQQQPHQYHENKNVPNKNNVVSPPSPPPPPEKGFYISFDDDNIQPKRPKPPLRVKKNFKKEQMAALDDNSNHANNGFITTSRTNRHNNNGNESSSLSSTSNGGSSKSDSLVSTTPQLTSPLSPGTNNNNNNNSVRPSTSKTTNLVIDTNPFVDSEIPVDEMDKKKERILMMSLQRRQQQEEMKARKEIEAQKRREKEKEKVEAKARKKEEDKARRNTILERHRLKKAIDEAEREGKTVDRELLNALKALNNNNGGNNNNNNNNNNTRTGGTISSGGRPRLRNRQQPARPRPKTIHVGTSRGGNVHHTVDDTADGGMLTPSLSSRSRKCSSTNLSPITGGYSNATMRRDYYRGSQDCLLAETSRTSSSSVFSDDGGVANYATSTTGGAVPASSSRSIDRHGSYRTVSRDVSLDRAASHIGHRPRFGMYQNNPRKSSSLMNLCGVIGGAADHDSLMYHHRHHGVDVDSGLGRATPPHHRALSPNQVGGCSGPGSLPIRKRFDDAASESGGSEYSGPRLYKQPAAKSNRGIILNAVEYCVFPGVVNREGKKRVLEEINRADANHFLILFRDAGCQYRGLYAFYPETDEVFKLFGTGPRQVTDRMFDKFFKYNSGGKCFSQVHTKHLTVTIDAFTIHNSLWQGKRVNLPSKRDMTIVI